VSDHGTRIVERHCDVVLLGTSADLLATAADLSGRGWSVIVVDADGPSRADVDRADADPPDSLREDIRRHGGEIIAARATRVVPRDDDHRVVELTGGHAILARWVVTSPETAKAVTALAAAAPDTGRYAANEADWDHRYDGEQMWSGNPNGSLVAQVSALPPGRALDVGAGEGGDAIWLAEQGWSVTASDISRRALDRVAGEAARRGLHLDYLHADANAADAYPRSSYDLVSAQYASIPRTPDGRAVRTLLAAVAPGGTLLVVSHDLTPLRTPIDTATQSRMFDPDAYVRVEDFLGVLSASPDWEIEVNELRDRPPGAASAHHVHDVILQARRHSVDG